MIERVAFKSAAGPVDGALALPAGTGKHLAVVVVQEWWGLNEQIQRTAERLAAEGFVALAPDLYHGKLARTADEASHMMNDLDWGRAMKDLAGAVDYLRAHPRGNGKVAITGFCMGGALTLAAAADIPGLAAAVPFYGVPGDKDWSKVTVPIQAHFSKTDDWATPAKIEAIGERVHGPFELFLYDADHAFMNEKRPEVYSPRDAEAAWQRLVDFLRTHA
jgi:carboxymethylenebutenolidase